MFFSLTKEEFNKVYDHLYVNVVFKDYSDIYKQNQDNTYQSDLMEELKIALEKKWHTFFEKEYSDVVKKIVFTTAEEAGDLDRKLLVSPSF